MSDGIMFKPCPFCGSKEVYLEEDHCDGNKTYQVRCDACDASGPSVLEGEVSEAVDPWNSVPRAALQWTSELPTEEGWYWWCGDTRCIPTIGRIGYQGSRADGLFTMPPMRSYVESCPITAVGGFWAGPLPEPEEPQK